MDTRRAIKTLAASGLHYSGARRAIAGLHRLAAGGRRIVIIGYHRVCSDFELERQHVIESGLISRATFSRHVEFLSHRFELATMSRAVDVLTGSASALRDLAVITFDDGYRDVLRNALPVLQSWRAPATLYLSTDVISRAGYFPHDRLFTLLTHWQNSDAMRTRATPFARVILGRIAATGGPRRWVYLLIRDRPPSDLFRLCEDLSDAAGLSGTPPPTARALDWDEVRILAANGVEIGAHTTSHCVLTHLDAAAIETDLRESRDAIEEATGTPVQHFAYCNGYYNQTVIAALKRTGYRSAVTTEDRVNRWGDDPYRLARRVLWEGSATGPDGLTSFSLLACQLDGAWSALGFDSSEPGQRPEPVQRRSA